MINTITGMDRKIQFLFSIVMKLTFLIQNLLFCYDRWSRCGWMLRYLPDISFSLVSVEFEQSFRTSYQQSIYPCIWISPLDKLSAPTHRNEIKNEEVNTSLIYPTHERIVCVFFLEDYVVMMDIRARWWYCCCCYGDLEESSSFRPRRLAHSAWLGFFFYGRLKRRMKQWNAQLSRLFRRSLFHHRISCYSLIQRIINVFRPTENFTIMLLLSWKTRCKLYAGKRNFIFVLNKQSPA